MPYRPLQDKGLCQLLISHPNAQVLRSLRLGPFACAKQSNKSVENLSEFCASTEKIPSVNLFCWYMKTHPPTHGTVQPIPSDSLTKGLSYETAAIPISDVIHFLSLACWLRGFNDSSHSSKHFSVPNYLRRHRAACPGPGVRFLAPQGPSPALVCKVVFTS